MNADPEVRAFFPSTLTKEQSDASIKRFESCFDRDGYCFYAVDKLVDQEFIGFIGFSKITMDVPFSPGVEIGWRLKKSEWGRGYATEGALRCLKYGFEELDFKAIYSFTTLTNKASEKVMQKIGMSQIGTFEHPKLAQDDPLRPHVLYLINR